MKKIEIGVVKKPIVSAMAFSLGFLAAVTTLSLTACDSKPAASPQNESLSVASNANAEESSSEETQELSEVAEVVDVDPFADFKDTPDSQYFLILDGTEHDVTDYVVTANEGFCTYKSSILEDVFGFEKVTGEDEDIFVTYKRDDDVVKFELGGPYIIVNENRYTAMDEITPLDGSDEAVVPLDFIFGIGYDKYSTQREGDNLRIIVGSTLDEVPVAEDGSQESTEAVPEGSSVATETMSEEMPESADSSDTLEETELTEEEESNDRAEETE